MSTQCGSILNSWYSVCGGSSPVLQLVRLLPTGFQKISSESDFKGEPENYFPTHSYIPYDCYDHEEGPIENKTQKLKKIKFTGFVVATCHQLVSLDGCSCVPEPPVVRYACV